MNKLNENGKIIITTPNYRGLWLLLKNCKPGRPGGL